MLLPTNIFSTVQGMQDAMAPEQAAAKIKLDAFNGPGPERLQYGNADLPALLLGLLGTAFTPRGGAQFFQNYQQGKQAVVNQANQLLDYNQKQKMARADVMAAPLEAKAKRNWQNLDQQTAEANRAARDMRNAQMQLDRMDNQQAYAALSNLVGNTDAKKSTHPEIVRAMAIKAGMAPNVVEGLVNDSMQAYAQGQAERKSAMDRLNTEEGTKQYSALLRGIMTRGAGTADDEKAIDAINTKYGTQFTPILGPTWQAQAKAEQAALARDVLAQTKVRDSGNLAARWADIQVRREALDQLRSYRDQSLSIQGMNADTARMNAVIRSQEFGLKQQEAELKKALPPQAVAKLKDAYAQTNFQLREWEKMPLTKGDEETVKKLKVKQGMLENMLRASGYDPSSDNLKALLEASKAAPVNMIGTKAALPYKTRSGGSFTPIGP